VLNGPEQGRMDYRLLVQKQAGTAAVPFELVVLLPPGATLDSATPAGVLAGDGSSLTISTDLRTDRAFDIVYRPGREKP
jgi:hypothetical protein